MSSCVVRGCTVSNSNQPVEEVMLFTFPSDERLPAWVEAVKGKGSDWVPPSNAKICSQHFVPEAFSKNHPSERLKTLLPDAIPIPAVELPPASTNCRSSSRCGCVVRGCRVSYSNLPDGVRLFSFPSDERRPRWAEAVKGKGTDWVPPKSSRICSLHFAPNQFWKNPPGKTKILLLPGAIPFPAVQHPPASSIKPKNLPNSTSYFYGKKEAAGVQRPNPNTLASPQQQQQSLILASQTSVLKDSMNTMLIRTLNPHVPACKASAASPDSIDSNCMQLPSESPAAVKMARAIELSPPITPHTPASDAFESLSSSSTTSTGVNSSPLSGRRNHSALPSSSPSTSSCKRSTFPPAVSENPSKAMSGAPVPVCLDIEEGDSPRNIALKQMIMHLENEVRDLRQKNEQEKKRYNSTKKKLDALKRKVRKVSQNFDSESVVRIFQDLVPEDDDIDLDLCSYSIDAPSHWGDKAIVWHARPSVIGR